MLKINKLQNWTLFHAAALATTIIWPWVDRIGGSSGGPGLTSGLLLLATLSVQILALSKCQQLGRPSKVPWQFALFFIWLLPPLGSIMIFVDSGLANTETRLGKINWWVLTAVGVPLLITSGLLAYLL